jgi:hypothetical protein
VSVEDRQTFITLGFAGPGVGPDGSLPDGSYTLSVDRGRIPVDTPNPITTIASFQTLFGDLDGDGRVNGALAKASGSPPTRRREPHRLPFAARRVPFDVERSRTPRRRDFVARRGMAPPFLVRSNRSTVITEILMSLFEKVVPAVVPSTSSSELDAIELLKKDHDEVDALFDDYQSLAERDATPRERRALSTRICGLVAVHAMIEEEIFYPAARRAKVDSDLLDEAEIEHGSAKQLIAEIGAARAADPRYDARVKVLGEYIRHHVREEENELFTACRKSDMDMAQIGARLQARKDELMRALAGQADDAR